MLGSTLDLRFGDDFTSGQAPSIPYTRGPDIDIVYLPFRRSELGISHIGSLLRCVSDLVAMETEKAIFCPENGSHQRTRPSDVLIRVPYAGQMPAWMNG